MDFDALLDDDEAFGGVDFDQLESHARSKQPPPLPRPAGSGTSSGHNLGARPMTSHPVPKPYRQQQQAPVASSSRTTYNSPTQGPVLSQTGLWGSQPIQVRQAAALQVSQPKAKDTTVAVKVRKESVWIPGLCSWNQTLSLKTDLQEMGPRRLGGIRMGQTEQAAEEQEGQEARPRRQRGRSA